MKFYIYQSSGWRWRAKAKNGKIIADSSEGYKNKGDCLSALKSLILACVMADDESKIIADE